MSDPILDAKLKPGWDEQKIGISGKSLVEINADLQSRLTAAETRINELEKALLKETKLHEGIEAMDQGIINNLRAELDKLKGSQ